MNNNIKIEQEQVNNTENYDEKEPLVSVIMPAFNSQRFLYESVKSIIDQTYRNLELLIIDDSPEDDGSESIITSFDDDRIRYIKPPRRLGIPGALNYGVSISRGIYIARMDTDDISHIRRFEKQVEFLKNHQEIGIVGCSAYLINKSNKVIGIYRYPEHDNDIKVRMLMNCSFVHPAVMIRKSILQESQYDETCFCCEDTELWTRLMKQTKFYNLQQNLFKYRITKESGIHSQLIRLQTDDVYYKRHLNVMKKTYDQAFGFFSLDPNQLSNRYDEYLFAKRVQDFSQVDKAEFVNRYRRLLSSKIDNKKQIEDNASYIWLKLTTKKYLFTKDLWLIINGTYQVLKFTCRKVIAIVHGLIGVNKNLYSWKI